MRTFGTEADNLIDVELAYGTNNYQLTWFQNGLQRDIEVTKATIHFVGAKLPLGNVTIDYLELSTDYLNFLEEDAIRIDITEDDSILTIGTYYVAPGFTKTKYDAAYTAYSSLIDLGLKLDAWSDAPESATIGTIVHHFIDPLDIVFDTEPLSTITFNASMTDFSCITLGELLGYCACIEQCNYVLRGNVLCKVVPAKEITKEYNIDDVVYTENLSQVTSDAVLDYIKINYKTVSQTEDEEGQVSYEFNDASYICKDGTESCGFELSIGLVPTSESALQSHFSNYFISVKGMDCNGYNISFLGDARVEVGDKLKFSNDGTTAVLNVAELVWEWDGGLKCTISSGSESSNSSSGFSIQQVVSQIQAMTNAVKNVQYNAVYANELYAKTAELGFASIKELTTEVAKMGLMTVKEADIAYAKIDFSNIETATIGKMFADIGLVSDMTIVDGHITGTLSGVKITGDVIETNTIKADSLLLTGEDGIIYRINATASGLSKEELSDEKYQKYLSGTDIVAGSITSTQLAANSVTADKILSKAVTADKLSVNTLSAISADLGTVTAGVIQSSNYEPDAAGMKLNLSDGSWDSRYTKIAADGSIECENLIAKGGSIAGLMISDTKLYNDIFSLEQKNNGVEFVIKDTDLTTELFAIKTSHPANSVMWNSLDILNFNEVNISADDVYINKINGYVLGDACEKGVATSVASGNTNLVTSGAVYTALADKVNTSAVINIAHGGTGATTAAQARTNLGITCANLGISGYTILDVQRVSVSTGSTIAKGTTQSVTVAWSAVRNATGYIVALNTGGNAYGRISLMSAYVTTSSATVNCTNESSASHTITGYLTVIAVKQI